MQDWDDVLLSRGLRVLAIIAVALVLRRLAKFLTRRFINRRRLAESEEQQHQIEQVRTVADLLLGAITAIIVALAVLTALPVFGVNITPFAAAAGLASLAVGFGGQYLARDLINGMVIIFENQYVVGETIRVGDVSGMVEHVTLRRTVLRAPTGALVSIPNGMVDRVLNLSRDWALVLVDVSFVPEGDALDRVPQILERLIKALSAEKAWSKAVMAQGWRIDVTSVSGDKATIRVELRVAPRRRREVSLELRTRIRRELSKEGVHLLGVEEATL